MVYCPAQAIWAFQLRFSCERDAREATAGVACRLTHEYILYACVLAKALQITAQIPTADLGATKPVQFRMGIPVLVKGQVCAGVASQQVKKLVYSGWEDGTLRWAIRYCSRLPPVRVLVDLPSLCQVGKMRRLAMPPQNSGAVATLYQGCWQRSKTCHSLRRMAVQHSRVHKEKGPVCAPPGPSSRGQLIES